MVLTQAGQETQCQGQNLQWGLVWDQAVSSRFLSQCTAGAESCMARPVAPDKAKGGLFGFWFFQCKNLPNMKKAATNTEPHADAEKE